ncbi:MAG: DUF5103 domain-containing protein [Prevotella sp.]|nr:DUF5103 domain-containing protein [Prevotella sp.]
MRFLGFVIIFLLSSQAQARSVIYHPQVKTLQVVVNQDWLSPPVMRLGSDDVLNIGFDELSHTFHRYIYKLERCETDWTASEELFESDWLEGFNGNTIDDYENSLNTTVLYTHYTLQIPNDRCRLKMSGNYKLHIYDEDNDDELVLTAEFRVVESLTSVGLAVTTNTDIDFNVSHQQVSMTVNLGSLNVINIDEQLQTIVMQNGREDNMKVNPRPNIIQHEKLQWEHHQDLIFDAGNEYHKFEVLDVSHPTMGIDHILWDGTYYQAYPFANASRRSYLYDQDADGAFYIRNSDNIENDRTCDYVYVNYKLMAEHEHQGQVFIDGNWTTEASTNYAMTYQEADRSYNARILQKQGYYSYQYLLSKDDGKTETVPEEGSFFETENRYQAFVYFKETGGRTWRLVGYQQIQLR